MKNKLQDKIVAEKEAVAEMRRIGTMRSGISIMKEKSKFRLLRLTQIRSPLANIMKENMLSAGGEAAVHKYSCACKVEYTDVLLMGTVAQYKHLLGNLKYQPFGGKKAASRIKILLTKRSR